VVKLNQPSIWHSCQDIKPQRFWGYVDFLWSYEVTDHAVHILTFSFDSLNANVDLALVYYLGHVRNISDDDDDDDDDDDV